MTGMAMVVGVVIGAGIFIKSGKVMQASGDNMWLALTAWLVGGLIMIASGFCFAKYATKISKYNGLVDYLEVASNRKFAYYAGYYSSMIYYPVTGANISIFASGYILNYVLGDKLYDASLSWTIYVLALAFVTFFLVINYFSPWLSNKFQISAMVIKLIPIAIIVVAVIFAPLISSFDRTIVDPFIEKPAEGAVANFGDSIKITAFAYNGWISATAINGELKDSKKNLPRALIGGTIAIMVFYICYFVGLSVLLSNNEMSKLLNLASQQAFYKLMGTFGVIFTIICVSISCLGNANAMIVCSSHGLFGLAIRGDGFAPKKMVKTRGDNYNWRPYLLTYGMMVFFIVVFFFGRVTSGYKIEGNETITFNMFPYFKYLDSIDEMVCSLIYMFYIPVYIYMMKNFKELKAGSRYILPIIATVGAIFMGLCGTGLFQIIVDQNPDSLYGFLMFMVICLVIFAPAEYLWRKHLKNPVIINN